MGMGPARSDCLADQSVQGLGGPHVGSGCCLRSRWLGRPGLHLGAAEGIEEFLHEGCICCWCCYLDAEGGVRLSGVRLNLLDQESCAQVACGGGILMPLGLGSLCPLEAVAVESEHRGRVLGVRPPSPGPLPEEVKGVPGANCLPARM